MYVQWLYLRDEKTCSFWFYTCHGFFIDHNETDMTIEANEAAQVLLTLVGFQRRRGIWSLKSLRKDAVVGLGKGVSKTSA